MTAGPAALSTFCSILADIEAAAVERDLERLQAGGGERYAYWFFVALLIPPALIGGAVWLGLQL